MAWLRNTLASYRRDLRRYLGVPRRAWRRRPRTPCASAMVAEFLDAAARGRPGPPAAERGQRGAHGGGGAGLSQVRGPRRAWRTRTRPPASSRPRRPSDSRRRCRSPTSRRSSPRPGSPGTTLALRDRALLEVLYGTGARISEAVGLDVDDLDLETGRRPAASARAARSGWCRSARMPPTACSAYLVRGRPELSAIGTATPAVFLNARGGRLSRQSAWTGARQGGRAGRRAGRRVTAHVAALVRDPPARRGCGRPGRAGAARARIGHDHPDLHARHRRPAPRGVRDRPSPRPRCDWSL